MDLIDPILATASSIYSLYEQVKANKERSCRIIRRVKAFEDLVKPIKKVKQAKASKAVEKPLNELYTTLISAEELLRKYTSASWLKRILKSGSYKDDFDNVNLRLADNFEVLVIALNLEHGHMLFKVFDEVSRKQEDVLDGQKDDAEMKQLLLQFLKEQEEKKVTAKELQELKDNVDKHMKTCE
ncbi:hypothetical protein LDENG_00209510 [Lucifuga dentata]|nr:hypothetical protein LDENG_00209510 [Lucifuga dentata]